MSSKTRIALLRGINVGGHNMVLMADLRGLAAELGWRDVQSYIQSGNLVFTAEGSNSELEEQLERAITKRYNITVACVVRDARDWSTYVAGNPFVLESERAGNLVMLVLSKEPPGDSAVNDLSARAAAGEEIRRVGDVLWIYYRDGAGNSKLAAGVLDRLVGSAVTTRNWRTVLQLANMAG